MLTQFQTAFNDNALKFLVIYLIVDLAVSRQTQNFLILIVGALFALPFILFSMTGGFMADRWSKRSVTIGTKWMEAGIIVFSLMALARASMPIELAGVFLLSSQGALFGPSKYGLLPELLPEKDLSWGNGVTELLTFLAAILATVAGGFLAFYFRGRQIWSGAFLLVCTAVGLAASYGITHVPPANPTRPFNRNPLGDLFTQIRRIRNDRLLSWAIVGNTYLWFLAALLQFTIVIYGHDILRIDDRHISYLQAAVAIGIGLGSMVTGYLSAGKIEYGLIPLGALGLTVFGFLSASHGISLERAEIYLGLLGFSGGFYAVPLNALIQHRPEPAHKGGVIAAANLLSFVGVFLAAGAYFALAQDLHLRANQVFFAGACMTFLAGLYAVVFFPNSLLRLGLWFLANTYYRIRVQGRDNIPERGPAFFITSPLTPTGALALTASTDRLIRFFVESLVESPMGVPNGSLALRVLRMTHLGFQTDAGPGAGASVPIAEAVAAALQVREVVCLVSPNPASWWERPFGATNLREILTAAQAPIVAVRVCDEPTMAATGPVQHTKPVHFARRITVRFGQPLPPSARLLEVARAIEALRSPEQPLAEPAVRK